MRLFDYTCLFTVMVILFLCTSGCTTTQNTPPGSTTPATTIVTATPVSPGSTQVQATSSTQAGGSGSVDTTIIIRYNDYDCLDVQKEMGVVYLNPDQKYTIRVSPPNNQVNVNILLLDVGDKERLQATRPEWNAIAKTWEYESIVPLLQFNDVSSTQEKTVTIKNQGKYFLCADDRKESGVNDIVIRVPVKMTKVG